MDQKPPQSPEAPQTPQTPAGPSTPPAAPAGDHSAPPKPEEHKPEEHKPEEHKPEEHPATPPTPAPAAVGTAATDHPANGAQAGVPGGTTPPAPGQPHEPQIHKSNAMLFAIVTIFVVIIGGVLVFIMSGSSQQAPVNNTVVPTSTPMAIPTEAPTVAPSPATPEEEVEAVNVTEDDSDLQEVEQDLQAL